MIESERARTSAVPAEASGNVLIGLAAWLKAGRLARGLSIEEVSRITRIPLRSVERLEAGERDGLPADVFVRGFVKSYARCVGLSSDEALERYQLGRAETSPLGKTAALLDTIAALRSEAAARGEAQTFFPPRSGHERRVESASNAAPREEGADRANVEPTIATTDTASSGETATHDATERKPRRGDRRRRGRDAKRQRLAQGSVPPPMKAATGEPVVEPVAAEPVAEVAPAEMVAPSVSAPLAGAPTQASPIATSPAPSAASVMVEPKVAFPRPAMPRPSLVIDDADPEKAEEQRAARTRVPERRTILPPGLLDDESSGKHLTLAVIILLIVATLTLSYLMRRPSSAGEGMTLREAPSLPATRLA